MTRLRLAVAGAAIAIIAVAASGCGSSQQAAENAVNDALSGSASVDIGEDGSVKVEGSEGTYQYGTGELPEGWPEEVPVPPGFTVMASAKSGDTFTAQFEAAGDQTQAVKDYAIWLQNNGWAIDAQIPPGTNGMWGFRAFGYSLTMLSTVFGDQTVVSVNITPV